MKGDLYIHPVSALRSDAIDWTAPVLALAVAAVATRVRRRSRLLGSPPWTPTGR
jgi:hypothetical protein